MAGLGKSIVKQLIGSQAKARAAKGSVRTGAASKAIDKGATKAWLAQREWHADELPDHPPVINQASAMSYMDANKPRSELDSIMNQVAEDMKKPLGVPAPAKPAPPKIKKNIYTDDLGHQWRFDPNFHMYVNETTDRMAGSIWEIDNFTSTMMNDVAKGRPNMTTEAVIKKAKAKVEKAAGVKSSSGKKSMKNMDVIDDNGHIWSRDKDPADGKWKWYNETTGDKLVDQGKIAEYANAWEAMGPNNPDMPFDKSIKFSNNADVAKVNAGINEKAGLNQPKQRPTKPVTPPGADYIDDGVKRGSYMGSSRYTDKQGMSKKELKGAKRRGWVQGYRVDAYHGTGRDLRPEQSRTYSTSNGDTRWFSSDAGPAHTYASSKGGAWDGTPEGKMVPVKLRLGRTLMYKGNGEKWSQLKRDQLRRDYPEVWKEIGETYGSGFSTDTLANAAKKHGYDSVVFRNIKDNLDSNDFNTPATTVYAIFRGSNIRGKYAAFRNKNRGRLADLLGAGTVVAGGAAAAGLGNGKGEA